VSFDANADVLSVPLGVPPVVHDGGPWGTVPELLFEKKGLIPKIQRLLVHANDSH